MFDLFCACLTAGLNCLSAPLTSTFPATSAASVPYASVPYASAPYASAPYASAPYAAAPYTWRVVVDSAEFPGSYNFPVFPVGNAMWAFHPQGN